MRVKTWAYFIKEAFKSIFRNGWMSLASAGVVTLTLFLLGSFMLLNFNLDFISSDIKSQIEVIAFVDDSVSEEQLDKLRVSIISLPEAEEVRFVSREEALLRLEQRLGKHGSLLAGYKEPGNNPLRHSFEVKSKIPEKTSELARKIKILPGIFSVDYGSEVVDNLFNVTRIINWVGLAFMLALGITAMFLIANTIKLTVFSRRQEITIMKFVGATDWFIRWPFFIEGLVLGLVGSMVPVACLYYIYSYAVEWVYVNAPFLPIVPAPAVFDYLAKTLISLGTAIGALGSVFSLRKFLKA